MKDGATPRRRLHADKHLAITPGQTAGGRGYHFLPYNWRELTRGDLAEIAASQALILAELEAQFVSNRLPWLVADHEDAGHLLRWEASFAIQLVLDTGRRLADLSCLRGFTDRGLLHGSATKTGLLFTPKRPPVAVVPFLRPSDEVGDEDEDDGDELGSGILDDVARWLEGERKPVDGGGTGTASGADASEDPKARKKLAWSERRFQRSKPKSNVRLDLPLSTNCAALLALRPNFPEDGLKVFRTPLRTLWKEVETLLTTRRGKNAPRPRHRSRTVEALERHRFSAMIWEAGGDCVAAARATGRYGNLTYAYEYGGSRLSVAGEGQDDPEDTLVGSEKEYATERIKEVVCALRGELEAHPSSFDALARYTAFIVAFSLGHRGTFYSLPATAAIDPETQFCVIQDKTKAEEPTEPRIVWVPDAVLLQIRQYEWTVRRLAGETGEPIFDTLREQLEKGELCFPDPMTRKKVAGLHDYLNRAICHAVPDSPLRPNVGRHWLRSELVGKCSGETVNAFLGHWNAGGDPWAHGSCLDPLAYREDLRRTLPDLLASLGIRPACIAPNISRNRAIRLPSKITMPERPAGEAPPDVTFHSCFASVEIGPRFRPTVRKIRERIVRTRPGMEPGQILASAIFNGALLDPSTWDDWLKATRTLNFSPEIQWVTMSIKHSGEGERTKIFRWCADDWTRGLLKINRAKGSLFETSRSAVEYLEEYLESVFEEQVTAGEFLSWARAFWALRLPTLLFDQATGELPCTALDSWAWSRLLRADERTRFGPKPFYDTSYGGREAQMRAVGTFQSNSTFSRENEIFDLVGHLQRVGECDALKARRLCLELLDDRLNGAPDSKDLSEAHKTLLRWCICLLGGALSQESFHRNSPYTVRLKLALVVQKVFLAWRFSRRFEFGLQDLLNAFETIPPKDECLGLAWAATSSLSTFLKSPVPPRRRPAGRLDEDTFVGPDLSPWVTAQVIDEGAYQELLLRLDAVATKSNTLNGRELRLIATLGYRAGLRLREVMGLRGKDFVRSEGGFELHIEHTRQRRLKTFTSRRLLPLHVLLSPEEIEDLQSWIEHRCELQQAIIKTDGIFQQKRHRAESNAGHEVKAKDVNATDKIFGQVFSRALIDLTNVQHAFEEAFGATDKFKKGDFRWLRHSFSNYLMLNLMLPEKGAVDRLPPAIACSVSWEKRNLLRAEFLGDERLGHSVLHAVSQAMGHTGIGRTLATYQHLLDLTLWLYVCRDPITTPSENATGKNEDSNGTGSTPLCWTSRSRNSAASSSYRVPKLKLLGSEGWPSWLERSIETSECQPVPAGQPASNGPSGVDEMMLPWPLLVLAVNGYPDLGKLLEPYGGLSTDAERWSSNGSRIAASFFTMSSGDARMTVPHGAAAQFELNSLWQRRPPVLTASEADALATFLGSFSVKNGYARMRDIHQATLFIDFLHDECGIDRELLQVAQTPAYNKVRKKKTGQAGADAGLWDKDFKGYPCLSFQLAKHEVGALGPTSDRSRRRTRPEEYRIASNGGIRDLADQDNVAGRGEGTHPNAENSDGEKPAFKRVRVARHMVGRGDRWMPRHGNPDSSKRLGKRGYDVPTNTSLVYAYKFFLFLLAVEHGIEPRRLPHLESKFHAKNTKDVQPEVVTAIYRARRGRARPID